MTWPVNKDDNNNTEGAVVDGKTENGLFEIKNEKCQLPKRASASGESNATGHKVRNKAYDSWWMFHEKICLKLYVVYTNWLFVLDKEVEGGVLQ